MKLIKLLADSGGTKTDWAALDVNNKIHYFTTDSYHPLNINDKFIENQNKLWQTYDLTESELEFFGAGCLKEENKLIVQKALIEFGFSKMKIESDLLAAAKVVEFPNEWIAICGTGSVLFRVNQNQISEIIGGKGWQFGDEGSGYYFGKLVVENIKYIESNCLDIYNQIVDFYSVEKMLGIKNNAISKRIYAQLPFILKDFQTNELISDLHKKNINLFFEKYGHSISSICLVGSYAYYHQSFFEKICNERKIKILDVKKRPMEILVNELKKLTI